MDFTIREENVRLLSSYIGEIEKRFNVTVTVEETTYAPSEKQTLRWVQLRGKDGQLTKCAKVRYMQAQGVGAKNVTILGDVTAHRASILLLFASNAGE